PYMALDTCAVDGLCATACPVGIDTGQLVKHLRSLQHSRRAHAIASWAAENFSLLQRALLLAIRTGHQLQSVFGEGVMVAITRSMRRFLGKSVIPLWTSDVP